jgi:hypothetical protein
MPKLTQEQADRIVAGWRDGDQFEGWENPAGPLFASGEYAEADITLESILAASGCPPPPPLTVGGCGTACSASAGRLCC